MTVRKIMYFMALFLICLGANIFYAQIPFQNQEIVAFHLNTLPVTWRIIANSVVSLFIWFIFYISCLNFKVSVESKHMTTTNRR